MTTRKSFLPTDAPSVQVVHRLPGRLRFTVEGALAPWQAEILLERALGRACPRFSLSFNERSGRFLLVHDPRCEVEALLGPALAGPLPTASERKTSALAAPPSSPEAPFRAAARIIVPELLRFLVIGWLTPNWLRPWTTLYRVWPFLWAGGRDLMAGRQTIEMLDAAAIGASLAQREFKTANTIAFLLGLGARLEAWTQAQARNQLSAYLQADEGNVWVLREGIESQVAASELVVGDRVVVRAGSRIPVDGVVESGEATVNQALMTGEALPVDKRPGLTVYAGAVVEEGELVVRSVGVGAQTRLARLARVIDQADAMQAEVVSGYEKLATKTVPFVFGASVLVGLLTRNWMRAASVLVVDFSCALKLATPLSVKAAMLEAARHGVLFKGGRHLERLADASVFVLDKTGTVTTAQPRVVAIHPFGGLSRAEVLLQAACLEEHFPHPVASAIVRQAQQEGLLHEERHARVEYVLAHGIASWLEGERVVVGGRHFVEEHEGVDLTEAQAIVSRAAEDGQSVIFYAKGGRLAGLLIIEDSLVPDAAAALARLRQVGSPELALMTGDSEGAARRAALQIGIQNVHAELLPEDKLELIQRWQAAGAVVAMVGDGVNDAAALAAADVGISLKHGAEIAREAADVVLLEGRLSDLVCAYDLSRRALARTRQTSVFAVGVNGALMLLGVLGAMPAGVLAVLHNASTVASCVWSLGQLLPAEEARPA